MSLIVRGVGGGLASKAFHKSPMGNTDPGTHIMMAGIIVQLVDMGAFFTLLGLTLWRAVRGGMSKDLKRSRHLVSTTIFSMMCILVRNLYRSV
jgi:RTA1 like protein